MFPREFVFCLFFNYAYMCTWMNVYKARFKRRATAVPN